MNFGSCEEKKPGTEADFEAFTFAGVVEGTVSINIDSRSITAEAKTETNLATIAPVFAVSKGAQVTVGGTLQKSGVTKNNFESSVEYVVISEDAQTTKTWTVSINKNGGGTGNCEILSFSVLGVQYQISGDQIMHMYTAVGPIGPGLGGGCDIPTSAVPVIIISDGATIEPSADTPQNFQIPITYRVTAEDGTTVKTYTVRTDCSPF